MLLILLRDADNDSAPKRFGLMPIPFTAFALLKYESSKSQV